MADEVHFCVPGWRNIQNMRYLSRTNPNKRNEQSRRNCFVLTTNTGEMVLHGPTVYATDILRVSGRREHGMKWHVHPNHSFLLPRTTASYRSGVHLRLTGIIWFSTILFKDFRVLRQISLNSGTFYSNLLQYST